MYQGLYRLRSAIGKAVNRLYIYLEVRCCQLRIQIVDIYVYMYKRLISQLLVLHVYSSLRKPYTALHNGVGFTLKVVVVSEL